MSDWRLGWQALRVYLAHYRQAPLQAGAILLGVVLAVTLLIGVKATNDNAIHSYQDAGEALAQQAALFISASGRGASVDEQLYFRLKKLGLHALPVVSGTLEDAQGRKWQIDGSDIVAALHSFQQQAPGFEAQLPLVSMLAGEPLILASKTQAQSMGVNDASDAYFTLAGQQLKVDVLPDSANLGNRLYLDISVAQSLLQLPGRLSYIALFGDAAQLKQQLAQSGLPLAGLQITEQDQGKALTDLTRSFHLNLNAMGMLAFLVGLFIAYNGVRYSLMKRQRLLLQLLQQGLSRRALMLSLLLELLLLVAIGSFVGFLLALQLSHWLQPMVAVTLEQLYGATLLPGNWQWAWLAEGAGLTLIAALLACVPLYRQLCQRSIAQGTQRFAQQEHHRRIHRRLFALGMLLLLLTAALYPFSRAHGQSLALMGLLTIAMPLLLPQVLQTSLSLLTPWVPAGLPRYAIAETRELTAPLALAMMALLLALCANIAMNTLVGSFDRTLRSWLNTRLHADLYIRPGNNEMSALQQYLDTNAPKLPRYYQWQAPFYVANGTEVQSINLLSRDPTSIAETTVFKQPDQLAKQRLAVQQVLAGQGIFISEPLALKLTVQTGDNVRLCQDNRCQHPHMTQIAGVYFDYGNPRGEALAAPTLWQQLQLPAQPYSLAIGGITAGQAAIDKLGEQIGNTLGLNPAQIYSQQKIRTQALKVFNKTFSITLVLNTLTLLVAAIGLFSAVLMLTQSRQAPLAILRSLGVPQKQLWLMLLAQILLAVFITCLMALPLGAILGYLLIHKVTLQAFGWTIMQHWDWLAYGRVVGLSLGCCLLAVLLPLYWQSRRSMVSALQQEVL
ncbi:ABC transporter permease [Shewanella sp. A32]|uniref:ABC transporter permease n=1 Tax=Shewanella sp. A32 TaxID=3031327 RepID=UPI0023BA2E6B|nr:ABC transporter permease [Shewanella sp. A32]MDF0533985.1 ABC transporter permease [Shewanella sp. A32]